MWRRYQILPVVLAGLWVVSGMAAGQAPTVASPAISPASKVPAQLPETDCSSMTQDHYRRVGDLLSRMMSTTSSIQALNLQIQALREQLGAERTQLAAGGITKGEQIRADQITQQMETLAAQIESVQDQIDGLVRQQRAVQEQIERASAEYAARRKALRCA
jgi:predicted  nucleic acid-binding Zn-ribbon protein